MIECLAVALAAAVALPESESGEASPSPNQNIVRTHAMVRRGLRYLASQQNDDFSFTSEPGAEVTQAPIAVTALSTLAFMAGGSTMGRGPYKEQVRGGIRFLIQNTVAKPPAGWDPDSGEIEPLYFVVESDATSKMHGHGYATLAVAQAYGTLALDPKIRMATEKARQDRDELRRVLVAAVRLIERSQTTVGGWYYEPYDTNHEGSVTVTMIQALRAARNVGVDVNKSKIDNAVEYLRKSQRPDGGVRYHLTNPSATYALTAAAIATLNATGDYDSDVIDRGIGFMQRQDPLFHPEDRWAANNNFPYYARLYAAQAYYMYRDPKLWQRWHELVIQDLENKQIEATGAFRNTEYGKPYATAVACLLLQLPYQYLPIFQK